MVDIANHYAGHFIGGALIEFGTASFDTNDTEVEVACGFSTLHQVQITPTVAHGATEVFHCDLTLDGGTVTVTRSFGTTIDLTFSYVMYGIY